MRKLLFIIVLFFSTSVLSVSEQKVDIFQLKGKFLFCETDKTKNEYYAAKYFFLTPSALILFKSISSRKPGGTPLFYNNDEFKSYKKISENEHHIFFEDDYEIDKIKGILSLSRFFNIPWQCEIIQKDEWFLPNK